MRFFCGLVTVYIKEVESQRIGDDKEARYTHGGGAEHRVHFPAAERDKQTSRQRNADDVVAERPEKVFADVLQGRASESDRGGDIRGTAVDEDGVRSIDGDIGTGTDGNPEIGACQRRCIVDTVTDHGNVSRFLQGTDDFFFSVGKNACDDLIDTCGCTDSGSGFGVVPGQQDDTDAHVTQLTDGFNAVLAERVCGGDDTEQSAVTAEVKRGTALHGKRFR